MWIAQSIGIDGFVGLTLAAGEADITSSLAAMGLASADHPQRANP
jgi:hypothetical protein